MKKYVGIIGIVLLISINCLVFKIVLDKKLDLVEVPITKQLIKPRTQITKDMIEIIEVPRVLLNEDCILEEKEAINKYTEIEGMIPKGSLLYKSMLFHENELPDSPTLKLKEGQNVFSLPIDLVKSSGNSLTNNQQIDLFVTIPIKKSNPVSDVLINNVRIINIVDRKGIDMRESETNIPSVINLAINKDFISLLKKANEVGTIDFYATTQIEGEECILNQESEVLKYLHE